MVLRFLLVVYLLVVGTSAPAAPSDTIGVARLFTNDYLGDGRDRWQSGSYVISHLRGPQTWDGAPQPFGTIREYRLRSMIIASDGRGPAPGDRPYVGGLSFGVHSHFGGGSTRAALGMSATAIGPQTGISRFQRHIHETLGMRQTRFTDAQLSNTWFFGVTAEVAEVIALSNTTTLRPFAEAKLGPEDLLRIGADLQVGGLFSQDIMLRDVVTGHLYPGTKRRTSSGFSFVAGADLAVVTDSAFLTGRNGIPAAKDRGRLRAGVHWQSDHGTHLFYGLTYLSPEFVDQNSGQVVGSVQLNFNF